MRVIGEEYHPPPWNEQDLMLERNGHVVSRTKQPLKSAPAGSLELRTAGDVMAWRDHDFDDCKPALGAVACRRSRPPSFVDRPAADKV